MPICSGIQVDPMSIGWTLVIVFHLKHSCASPMSVANIQLQTCPMLSSEVGNNTFDSTSQILMESKENSRAM